MRIVRGDRGTMVEYVQLALQRAGYPVTVDGVFGGDTCRALAEFLEKGEQDCIVDDSVFESLALYLRGSVRYEVQP